MSRVFRLYQHGIIPGADLHLRSLKSSSLSVLLSTLGFFRDGLHRSCPGYGPVLPGKVCYDQWWEVTHPDVQEIQGIAAEGTAFPHLVGHSASTSCALLLARYLSSTLGKKTLGNNKKISHQSWGYRLEMEITAWQENCSRKGEGALGGAGEGKNIINTYVCVRFSINQ